MKLLLIVEDDAWTRYALERLLKNRGWLVITASSLADGLERLDEGPDCVVVDLGLPDGNGEAILRRVREQRLDTRVIICTSIVDEIRLEGLESLRPDAVITKPVEVEELHQACCEPPETN
jgi:two-component system, OmpR family, KDP operon response regulator KdpE